MLEHRWHGRSAVNWAAELRVGNNTQRCRITNISREGMFVKMPFARLATGAVVRITCAQSGLDSDSPILGLVVHSSAQGYGILLTQTRAEHCTGGWRLVQAA